MGDIYTPAWYDEVRSAINAKVEQMKNLPTGTWNVAVDIVGDGVSPYVPDGTTRHFLIGIDGGHCSWYEEIEEGDRPDLELDFRFVGPAGSFDEVAAGLLDPIDAALQGHIRVRGDMRFLMRQAEHVKVLLDAYANAVETTWPAGRPPYAVEGGAVRDAPAPNAERARAS